MTTRNWQTAPLLRCENKVITTPAKSENEINCSGVIPRYNMGNIHEIKKFWNVTDDSTK